MQFLPLATMCYDDEEHKTSFVVEDFKVFSSAGIPRTESMWETVKEIAKEAKTKNVQAVTANVPIWLRPKR